MISGQGSDATCPAIDFTVINTHYGGQGELGVIFSQYATVETVRLTHSMYTADPALPISMFGTYGIGFANQLGDLLGAFFSTTEKFLVIEFDTTAVAKGLYNCPACSNKAGCANAITGAPKWTLRAYDQKGGCATLTSCAITGTPLSSVTLEGVAPASATRLRWTRVQGSLDISRATGAVTIVFQGFNSAYVMFDNLKIMASKQAVQVPRTQSCQAVGRCASSTTKTVAAAADCPCDLFSNDCRLLLCFVFLLDDG